MKLKFILSSLFLLTFCFTTNAQSGRKSNQPVETQNHTTDQSQNKNNQNQGEIKPVKIIRKPAPHPSVAADCHRQEGLTFMHVILVVTFDASAVISNVEVKSASGCREFDEDSIDAARRIKFEPAVQNGKPITVTKRVMFQGGVR